MIISHRHRFIFIKTKKTAGTSIEIELSKHCGPDDIITPLAPEDEIHRLSNGGRGAQNFSRRADISDGFRSASQAGDRNAMFRILEQLGPGDHRNHRSISEVERRCGKFPGYFRFTCERDPCDRILSFIYWKKDPGRRIPAARRIYYVLKYAGSAKFRNFPAYAINGEVSVDAVINFARLHEDFRSICDRVGLPAPARLIATKNVQRVDRAAALSRFEANVVRRSCRDEIEVLAKPALAARKG